MAYAWKLRDDPNTQVIGVLSLVLSDLVMKLNSLRPEFLL